MFPLAIALLALAGVADVQLHDFRDASVWTDNRDGGNAPLVRAEAPDVGGLRLTYTDKPPHWGNLSGPCIVPPDAVALRVRFTKVRGDGRAAMYIWMFEPDGDAWVQQLLVGTTTFGSLRPGPHTAWLPMSRFAFEKRGAGTREMTAVNRILIGCNYADLEVTMTAMDWETREPVASASLPRTAGLSVAEGARGSVAVLDMGRALPDGFRSGHSPARMASALRGLGFGVTMMQAGDLADPRLLDARNLDAVVLTSGPFFPVACREPFLAYLRAGGSFLTTDGYAFDRLVEWDGRRWTEAGHTAAQMAVERSPAAPMNTRTGKAGDAMTFAPEQIGLFDPQYPLGAVARVRIHPDWVGSPRPVYPAAKRLEGYSACALIGDNNPVFPPVYRSWSPVIEACDADGEPAGTLLSVVHNVDGPYKGSAWGFSGLISGDDLFLGSAARRALLGRVMDALVGRVACHDLTTHYASYAPGEKVNFTFSVSNSGRRPFGARLALEAGGKRVATYDIRLRPGERSEHAASLDASPSPSGLTAVRVRQIDAMPASGAPLTAGTAFLLPIETAFCVRDPRRRPEGPRMAWNGAYMTVDGRPTFLIGTNQTGMMFYSKHESPAVWDRDLRNMARHNLHLLRILHFSPFAARGYEGQSVHSPVELANRPERLRRQLDAIVHLAGRHRVGIFLSVHDWQAVALTDEELAAQADWNRFWADRYKDCPWVFFDVQNEPNVEAPDRPDIRAMWNVWLRDRYGSDAALREAWGANAPEEPLPDVPMARRSNAWDDVREADRKRFEAELLNRWVKANVEGLKAGNPDAPVTVGYLPSMGPADKMLGARHVDFSNMHYYGDLSTFPLEFKLTDRRFEGKGFSVGEFGAQEAHQARNQGSDVVPVEASVQRFRHMLHYTASMGAAFAVNWCWKEFDEAVFPWGLIQRGDGAAKPWLQTFAQGSLFLSFLEPANAEPEVYLLAPDRHRIGPRFNELHGALQRAAELLLDNRVNFGVINEEALDRLPDAALALVWPMPYCPDDETFNRVLAWVKRGGHLYLSGDVQFGPWRRPDRSERLAALGLPGHAPHNPFETPEAFWSSEPIAQDVGRGTVYFVPYPLELRRRPADAGVYGRFLAASGIETIAIASESGGVRAQSIPLKGGGRLVMLARPGTDDAPVQVLLTDAEVGVQLRGGDSALIVTAGDGSLIAIECAGTATLGGSPLARSDGQFGLVALDGKDLGASREVLILPHTGEAPGASAGGSRRSVELTGLRGVAGRVVPHGRLSVGGSADSAWAKVKARLNLRP